jgi:hypothetical protein
MQRVKKERVTGTNGVRILCCFELVLLIVGITWLEHREDVLDQRLEPNQSHLFMTDHDSL